MTLFAFQSMRVPIRNYIEFIAIDHSGTDDKVLALRARALAIVYTVYNTITHHSSSSPPLDPFELIRVATTHR